MNKFIINDLYGYKDYHYLPKIIRRTLKLENVTSSFMEIILTDDEKLKELNKTYRKIDSPTDVLSFAFEDNNKICYNIRQLGEIYISIPTMKKQAKIYNNSEKRELALLVVHGLLHLLGYDHLKSVALKKEMFAKQEMVLNEFKETKKRT